MSNIFDSLSCDKKIDLLCENIGSVFFYRDLKVSDKERLYFLIGIDSSNLYFVHPQSGIKRRLIARNETLDKLTTLVIANGSVYPELRHNSIIDCNSIHTRTKDELIDLCKKGIFHIKASCSDILKQQIFSAIERSPRITPNIKAIIKSHS